MGINFEGLPPESQMKLNNILKDGVVTQSEISGLTPMESKALLEALGGKLPDVGEQVEFKGGKKTEEPLPETPKKKSWLQKLGIGAAVVGVTTVIGAIVGGAVGLLGGGVGAVPGAVGGAKAGAALGVLLGGATSCTIDTEPDVNVIHNETNYNINVSVLNENEATNELINLIKDLINQNADLKTAIEDLKNSQDENAQKTLELLQQLVERLGQLEVGIDQIAQILFEQGVSLDEIVALLEASNKTQDDILNELSNGHDEIRAYLENILNAINNGNEIDANTNKILSQLLEKVGNIESGDSEILAMLEKIFAFVQESIDNNNEMDEKTYALLETLVKSVQEGNAANAKFYEAILNKLDGLEGVMKDYLKNILDAVNANGTISEDIRNLTQKVLEQINNHAVADNDALKAILEAINNLSVGSGGNVDLSKIEEMLAALLKQTAENGDILTDINGKLDVINMTIKAATDEIKNLLGDKFDQNNEYFKQIIDKLEGLGGEGYDDTELLEKLDTILNILGNINNNTNKDDLLAKLDEILAAIKDHKVIVDVTGKITCDCNCGQNHEGIVGDLGDLLG